jgi:multidrug efflux pump
MSISSTSIKRPVLTIVLSIVIVLFGVVGFTYLGVREFPAVDPPTITVRTSYTGANADVIESQITEPLEESINGIDGIRTISSTSAQGVSTITVEFNLDADLEAAANDVRDRVSRAVRNLPEDLTAPPAVTKADANSDPIIAVLVSSETRNPLELTDFGTRVLKEQLQTIPGVSEVRIWGEKKFSMRLRLDPVKLAAYGITPLDVQNALQIENVELPSGKIAGNNAELTVRTFGRMTTEEELNNLIVKEAGGKTVRMRDVGYAELGAENEETNLKGLGIPMIGVAVSPQPGANYIAIAEEFYKRLDHIMKDVPPDIRINPTLDTTKFVKKSITEVEETIFIAFGLVVIIVFLFLRDWRSTLIPVIAIPISLVGTFFIMYLAGFSINVLTLLGIVLATGLVVDDAIVVLENIYSKVEAGEDPMTASFKGSNEIFFAIISTTVTLAAVFLPIIFLEGFTGRLFREFGVVVAGSVLISAFVSLTLTPMMSSRMLRKAKKHSRFYEVTERFFEKMNRGYESSLAGFMRKPWLTAIIIVVSGGLIFIFLKIVPSELAPVEDRSQLRVQATAPEGTSYEYMDRYMDQLNKFVGDSLADETTGYLTVTAPGFSGAGAVNSGFMRIVLKDPGQRERTQQEIASYLSKHIRTFSGARGFVNQEPTITTGQRGNQQPVQFVIQARDFEKLREYLPKFLEEVGKEQVLKDVDVNLKFNKPELEVKIDREKARNLGVSVRDVALVLQSALSGQRYGYFIMNGKQYQVIGQVSRERRDEPVDLRSLYVNNREGTPVQLSNIITDSVTSSPPQMYHYNRYQSATVNANLADGATIAQGIDAMRDAAQRTLDETFSTSLTGASRDYEEGSSGIVFALVLALALIYLVLAAQFESFIDPLIIMLTVPLAFAGALLCLWYFDQTLNIFSQIGIIMLIGLVTKNAILIVEFANQKKEQGLPVADAVKEAAASRFRPILMTSLATVLGALPIALSLGAGSSSRVGMGVVVVGGLMFSTALTLYIIPVIYTAPPAIQRWLKLVFARTKK